MATIIAAVPDTDPPEPAQDRTSRSWAAGVRGRAAACSTLRRVSHPPRYDPDDPLLHRVRDLALVLPEAQEKVSHGHPVWFTGKVFAVYGGLVKGDHSSDRYARSVLVLPEEADRSALLQDERCFLPAYYGPGGWVGLDLTAGQPDWTEVAELLDASYRRTAPARLVAALDAR